MLLGEIELIECIFFIMQFETIRYRYLIMVVKTIE